MQDKAFLKLIIFFCLMSITSCGKKSNLDKYPGSDYQEIIQIMIKVSQYNKYLSYNKNKLFLEDVALENLVEKFETPLFCYSISQIEHNFNELNNAFKKIKPLICYALKANFNDNIIKILSKLGCGIDVVSNGELQKSLKNGVNNQKIVFQV